MPYVTNSTILIMVGADRISYYAQDPFCCVDAKATYFQGVFSIANRLCLYSIQVSPHSDPTTSEFDTRQDCVSREVSDSMLKRSLAKKRCAPIRYLVRVDPHRPYSANEECGILCHSVPIKDCVGPQRKDWDRYGRTPDPNCYKWNCTVYYHLYMITEITMASLINWLLISPQLMGHR